MGRILDSETAWMASNRETVYKAAVARTKQFSIDREQFPNIDAPVVTNIDKYTGFDEATKAQIPGIAFPFTISSNRATPDLVAFIFGMAMGKVASAVAYTGATKAKRHQMTRQSGLKLPSCTWERRQSASLGEVFAGAVCLRAALSYESSRERFISLESDWIAGSYLSTASPTAIIDEADEKAIEYHVGNTFIGTYTNDTPGTNLNLASDAAVTDFATPATKGGSMHALLTALSYEYNNNVDIEQVFRSGEGLYPYEVNRGQVTQTLSATFIKDSAFNAVATVSDLEDLSFETMVQGEAIETKPPTETEPALNAYEGIRLLYPRVSMSNPQESSANNEIRTAYDLSIRRKSASVEGTYLQIFNAVAAYS